MCDDLTRREILFFSVMQSHPNGISEDDIFDGMSKLSAQMEWLSYLNAVPRPLSERLEEARDRSMIAIYQPLRWRPASGVAGYVRHLVNHYLEKPEQRDKIFALLNDKLHAAEAAPAAPIPFFGMSKHFFGAPHCPDTQLMFLQVELARRSSDRPPSH